MRVFRILATVLFILSIPTALVTANIRFIANEPRIYRYAIDQYDAVQTSGIAREELLRASAELREYFRNDEEVLTIRVQRQGQEISLFNARETAHMVDVKDRFNLMNRVQEFSLLYVIVYIAAVVLWAKEVSPRDMTKAVIAGSLIALVALAAVGGLSAAGFESAWEDFHLLIFSNDFWRLNPATDHLIQMFPPPFWESVVFLIGMLVAAEAALILLGAVIYLGVTGRQPTVTQEPRYA